ncbi:WASH complex subunit 5-like isoform X2 [Oppia nitens]|uniref:WASH complex subunit 5-like isoform X2 n=1 Tax=Oppia nitens TaxID=1686743 RepID=UPI0023DC55EE|nr:WASH complex subunit 5-like isoform X2 [Oppia nitens]
MSDFLSSSCGQNVVRLVSRGNAIIAELLRLSEVVPTVFRLETKSDQNKYSEVIQDFSYFKTSDTFDQRIESNGQLLDRDDEFRENYIEIITRFYLVFESIHRFTVDINRYVEDLEEGVYIQQSLESVLLDNDGKQLLCEALYLSGVMLLMVDQRIDGLVRERILVSYYRYSGQRSTSESNFDDVCKLLRNTGYTPNGKRPINYPDDYFKRAQIGSNFVNLVIGRLRSDDIYNQSSAFPQPEHRSVALATQAVMLYVVLYFSPHILHNESAAMREIVDKCFADNWIISMYMGFVANLVEEWDPYKSAKLALNNTIDQKNVKIHANKYNSKIIKLLPQLQQLLKEGTLTEEFLLNNVSKLMNIIRDCNVTLRWLTLHTCHHFINESNGVVNKKCKQLRDLVIIESKYQPLVVFQLLLNTAEFELKIKEMYKQLLSDKQEKWNFYKKEAFERISELAEVFSGNKPLTRIEKNTSLEQWLREMSKQIDGLIYDETNVTNRKTIKLIQALEEVQEFHQLESNLHVRQFLIESQKMLHNMIKTQNIKEDVLITLQIVGDLSFAWKIIDTSFTKYMQSGIKSDPTLVIKLRATFLKLASALDMPLLRINQASILHIIPETMFSLMARIIELQTNNIKELPTRLMKDQMKTYSQLEERHEVAKLTHSISVFTEGILAMKATLIGIIQIDPKRLLEDGIRRELVIQAANALHKGLVFNSKAKTSELVPKLKALAQVMDGFRRSFEYIQDYVCIYGLKMWQQEVSRIVNYNVEQECNAFMRHKVLDYQSVYQSASIPIPKFLPMDPYSINFIGRLARELLRMTDPKNTIYVHSMSTWFDNKTHLQVVDTKLFPLMMKSIGTAGINGLDRLISFMIVTEIQNIMQYLDRNFTKDKHWPQILLEINENLGTTDGKIIGTHFSSIFGSALSKATKSLPAVFDAIARIGQMQIIRCNIGHELNTTCKLHSRHLANALNTLNQAIISDLEHHYSTSNKPFLKEDTPLLYELTNYLEWTGISDPLSKIYITSRAPSYLEMILLLMTITQMGKFVYLKSIHGLTAKKGSDLSDGLPFVFGVITLLRQFHENTIHQYIAHCSQYVCAQTEIQMSISSPKVTELPPEVYNTLEFLENLIEFSGLQRKVVVENIPDFIFDQFHTIPNSNTK